MPIIACDDDKGFLWAVVISADGLDDECEQGIVIGPPAGLPKVIHNALVKAGFYRAPDLMGKRKQLRELVKKQGYPEGYERIILSVYQKDYYEGYDDYDS